MKSLKLRDYEGIVILDKAAEARSSSITAIRYKSLQLVKWLVVLLALYLGFLVVVWFFPHAPVKLFQPNTSSDIVPDQAIDSANDLVWVDISRLNIPFTTRPKVVYAQLVDTGSMLPVFDAGHNVMLLAGSNDSEQRIMLDWIAKQWTEHKKANILVYRTATTDAIHRLLKVDSDSYGRRWWFGGDNNGGPDPGFARDDEVKWLAIGVIY